MGGCAVAKGGSGVAAGLGKLVGAEAAGGGWAAATALLGGAANAELGVAARVGTKVDPVLPTWAIKT